MLAGIFLCLFFARAFWRAAAGVKQKVGQLRATLLLAIQGLGFAADTDPRFLSFSMD